MNILSILFIALVLSVDSLIAALTCGLQSRIKRSKGLSIAVIFAVCQGSFELLGSLLGGAFQKQVDVFDHWIAFGLLSIIGLKMLLEIRNINKNNGLGYDISKFLIVLGLGIATSIDAFIIGIGLGLEMPHFKERFMTSLIIASVTFFASMLGIMLGRQNKFFPAKWAAAAGGVVLILIGVKILIEHL